MHAFLLVNTDPIQFAKKENAKVIPFELQKIEDTRNLKKLVKFKFNEKTAIVINGIDNATNEALNAFLKNLEEPSPNLIYILTATNLKNVLPTIVSRCEVIQSIIDNKELDTSNINHKDGLNIKDRDEALKFVEDLIFMDYQKKNFDNIENYLQTLQNLKANGNVSLQMTNLVAKMSSTTN
jgi:DNA polymerase III delta prime subunit